ncbi:hypothetical protein [Candidatus Phytoplasma fraxini]|uniref:Uncharacterized protein n=1 Tax=Ash yellows phytoplasma TaxID=35780 RepID=A0ABZ2U838_ASHYP
MYCRFIRWSLDRISKGWIAMFLPNSFLNTSIEGLRRTLTQKCQQIYIVDLKGKAGVGADKAQEGDNVFETETQSANTQGCCLLLCYKVSDTTFKNKTFYVSVPPKSITETQEFIINNYQKDVIFLKKLL